jgi:protein-L-isoaspartate(D-aspartate) O-methyltransferase
MKSMSSLEDRTRMVQRQIADRGIRDDRVLEAMLRVPRHAFVPDRRQLEAYEDRALPIGGGQTISQPFMVARMTTLLEIRETDRVLEIGTGSGYQTAILAELAGEVYTVERIVALAERALKLLAELGYRNIRDRIADGSLGWPEEAPLDRILLTAASPATPSTLLDQLVDGGLLVAPIGRSRVQDLVRFRRTGDRFERELHGRCSFVKLIGKEGFRAL